MTFEPVADGYTPSNWATSHFAIVTLWGGRAHAEQTLEWLATAEVPPNTVLYWLDNSGGKFTAPLREAWERRLRSRFRRLVWFHGGAPYVASSGSGVFGRLAHISRLYNR